ncbi:MAG: hypothetical protein KF799_14660 [Bdellovibrionales bacterium]|nr:hypothetical protein [Bdellovibrionales bacterium]
MRALLKMTIACLGFCSLAAWAADESAVSRSLPEGREPANEAEMKPSIGIMGGYAETEANRRSGTNYGVEYGFQPYIPLGVAIELSGYVSPAVDNEATLTRTRLLGKANYNFGGDIPVVKNSYVGIGLGPVWDNVLNTDSLQLGIAPQIGFDIPITRTKFSLGANANYLFVSGAKADVFALNGMAKYWF